MKFSGPRFTKRIYTFYVLTLKQLTPITPLSPAPDACLVPGKGCGVSLSLTFIHLFIHSQSMKPKILNHTSTLPWHPWRRWSVRNLNKTDKIIIHQELAEGDIRAVNQYHISSNHISKWGCPHFCYHFGIENNGDIVQANELRHVTWHTTGQNETGIGIMLVGNFAGPGHNVGTREPAPEQVYALSELCDYLQQAFGLCNQDIYGHYQFGKPSCPGFVVQEWIENRRNRITDEEWMAKAEKNIFEIQRRLNLSGFPCGEPDGIMGIKTQAAIRKFQRKNLLHADGLVGPDTWKHLLASSQKH